MNEPMNYGREPAAWPRPATVRAAIQAVQTTRGDMDCAARAGSKARLGHERRLGRLRAILLLVEQQGAALIARDG